MNVLLALSSHRPQQRPVRALARIPGDEIPALRPGVRREPGFKVVQRVDNRCPRFVARRVAGVGRRQRLERIPRATPRRHARSRQHPEQRRHDVRRAPPFIGEILPDEPVLHRGFAPPRHPPLKV